MFLFEVEYFLKLFYCKKIYLSRMLIDKLWVILQLKEKYNKYRYYFNLFNWDKGSGNYSNLMQLKKEYKIFVVKLK